MRSNNKGREYATRVTKSGAGVDADRGKGQDRELVDLGGSRVPQVERSSKEKQRWIYT